MRRTSSRSIVMCHNVLLALSQACSHAVPLGQLARRLHIQPLERHVLMGQRHPRPPRIPHFPQPICHHLGTIEAVSEIRYSVTATVLLSIAYFSKEKGCMRPGSFWPPGRVSRNLF